MEITFDPNNFASHDYYYDECPWPMIDGDPGLLLEGVDGSRFQFYWRDTGLIMKVDTSMHNQAVHEATLWDMLRPEHRLFFTPILAAGQLPHVDEDRGWVVTPYYNGLREVGDTCEAWRDTFPSGYETDQDRCAYPVEEAYFWDEVVLLTSIYGIAERDWHPGQYKLHPLGFPIIHDFGLTDNYDVANLPRWWQTIYS